MLESSHSRTALRVFVLSIAVIAVASFTDVIGQPFLNLANQSDRIPQFLGDGRAVAIGDVDGDGDLDIFVGTDDGPARDRLLINTNGEFVDDTTRRMDPKSGFAFTEDADFADIENDGDLDIIIAQATVDGGQQNLVFVNNGQGFFSNETLQILPVGSGGTMDRTFGVATGDVNGDGFVDIYFANAFTTGDNLFINDGTGRFRDNSSSLPTSANSLNSISPEFGDVDGDGDLDLMIGTGGNAEFVPHIFINNGLGTFSDQTEFRFSTEVSANAFATELVDVDGDGDLDALFCNFPGRARIMINNGAGFFRDETDLRLPFDAASCTALDAGDFDDDGDLDIALGRDPFDSTSRLNLVLINSDGAGNFIAAPLTPLGDGGGFSTAWFDADQDDDLDLIFLNEGEDQLWINLGEL